MHVDILIFAVIAAFLIYRLNAVLGTRHGDERQRPNPFAAQKAQQAPEDARPRQAPRGPVIDVKPAVHAPHDAELIDAEANRDGRIDTGLDEIADADAAFNPATFLQGARAAFEIIVTAYNNGDLGTLRPLVSPRLYKDFEAGVRDHAAKGQKSETIIHRIKSARISEAHLGGAMAYVTVAFEVDETAVTRDAGGNTVAGDADRIFTVRDIWTFTRDTRSDDPNWVLIETRSAEFN